MSAQEVLGFLLPELIGVALIALAVLVARTGWPQRPNRIFAALYFLSGTKSLADGLVSTIDGQLVADSFHAAAPLFPPAAVWQEVQLFCGLFMAPLLLLFVASFPKLARILERHPVLFWLAFVPSFVLAIGAIVVPDRYALIPYFVGFEVAVSAVTIFALVHWARVRGQAQDARERTQATYLMAGFLPAFVITWALTADDVAAVTTGAFLAGPRFHEILIHYVSPVLELAAAALVAYAILKYRFLNIELQVKGGVKYVIMSALIGTFLFVVSTYVGNFVLQARIFSFAGPEGSAVLAGIASILLFKPVEKVSARITDRIFPETTKDPKTYARLRAREVYRVQCTYVLRDEAVTDRELAFLVQLRSQLELSEDEAHGIEDEVEHALGVDDARLGHVGRLRNLAAVARSESKAPKEVVASSPSHQVPVPPPPPGSQGKQE